MVDAALRSEKCKSYYYYNTTVGIRRRSNYSDGVRMKSVYLVKAYDRLGVRNERHYYA